jgi:hypothetical protein
MLLFSVWDGYMYAWCIMKVDNFQMCTKLEIPGRFETGKFKMRFQFIVENLNYLLYELYQITK